MRKEQIRTIICKIIVLEYELIETVRTMLDEHVPLHDQATAMVFEAAQESDLVRRALVDQIREEVGL
jgi:hypothetical protein